ncbi:MAG: hypothetical protein A2189_03055 [Paenibacillus sp. RIFOXYA1_FULL_44_5]|nr:MAG: hypothetical protein A2189_03055 [Paenibacillus sp. RIFOXYA1_FULL_44_5]
MVIALIMSLVTACGTTQVQTKSKTGNMIPGNSPADTAKMYDQSGKMLQQPGVQMPVQLAVTMINNKPYVSVDKLVSILQFHTKWNPNTKTMQIGDNDVEFELSADQKEALKEGDKLFLQDPPVMYNDKLYMTVTAAADLFHNDMHFKVLDHQIRIYGLPEDMLIKQNVPQSQSIPGLEFREDPQDPNQTSTETGMSHESEQTAWSQLQAVSTVASPQSVQLKNINMSQLISTANRYLGVKYEFGAKPYPVSGTFDCSSFTQYVFGKFGISLPRISRTQAQIGMNVSRNNLRVGDLLFFYVPGRFKTNTTVGHVGIYIGNMQMIDANTAPKNGVQINKINTPYWQKTFLKAKRIAY